MIDYVKKDQLNELNKLLKYFDTSIENFDIIAKHPFSKWLVYIINNELVGFLNYYLLYENAELEYIYVLDKYRKKGIGFELMNFFINEVKSKKCINITLEVNINNIKAISLYKKFGFEKISIRKNYYGADDALLMLRKLGD